MSSSQLFQVVPIPAITHSASTEGAGGSHKTRISIAGDEKVRMETGAEQRDYR